MKILSGGHFVYEYSPQDLNKGLRKYEKTPRDNKPLAVCDSMVGQDGILQGVERLTVSREVLTAYQDYDFPWPQLFVTEKHILLCDRLTIHEWDGSDFVSKVSVSFADSGGRWHCASSYEWLILVNGDAVVIRNPESKTYIDYATDELDAAGLGDLKNAAAALNFNGQIFIGVNS